MFEFSRQSKILSYARSWYGLTRFASVCAIVLPASLYTSQAHSSQIHLQVVDAPLPLVLDTVATSAGLDPRLSDLARNRAERIAEVISGNGVSALESLSQRFGLILYIDEDIVWIDNTGEKQQHVIHSNTDTVNKLYNTLSTLEFASDGELLRGLEKIQISGTREFVARMTRQAEALIAQPSEPAQPVRNADVHAATVARTSTASIPEVSLAGTANSRRIVSSITDVPGYDTEYIE